MNTLNSWGPVAVIVAGYVLGQYFQNRRIDDLRAHMDRRIDDLRAQMDKRFDDLYRYLETRFNQKVDAK